MAERKIDLPKSITVENASEVFNEIQAVLKEKDVNRITLEFDKVEKIDSAGVIALNKASEIAKENDVTIVQNSLSDSLQYTIDLFSRDYKVPESEGKGESVIARLGEGTYNYYQSFKDFILLLADITYFGIIASFKTKLRRKGEVLRQSVFIGADALPIIALIAFLIGFILALQSANQLRQFGANIYVADLVAVAMVSEMGPLITAIMVAGRSGSSIAAEIATMQVTEEIDALRSMGINPAPYLFVPKTLAIVMMLPLLTILANLIGIFGGGVIGYLSLDIQWSHYFNEVLSVLRYKEIVTSIVKSLVFAVLIVISAIHFGLRVKGGAEGVGKATTASVVTTIFLVIVADSILGLFFYLD
jgi:phospholipid/cholesterol/gamma-HCH transport system permease protein